MDMEEFYERIHNARKALVGKNADDIQTEVDNLKKIIFEEYHTTEEMKLLLDYADVLVDYYIFQKDYFSLACFWGGFASVYIDFDKIHSCHEDEKRFLRDIFLNSHIKAMRFMKNPFSYFDIQENDGFCKLCKKNKADKTGSHIVPHFLIQRFFFL